MKKDKSIESNEVVNKNVVEISELNAIEPIELVDRKNEMEDGTNDELVRSMKDNLTEWKTRAEVLVEMHSKNKINFFKISKSPSKIEKKNEEDINPITSTTIVSRRILEWEERIKYHQEKEMGFNKWRSKVFDDEYLTYKKEDSDVIFDKEKLENS
nr:hypothetical protein [Tanacetum cinerariifolium]